MLNEESKAVIKAVYKALLRAHDRLIDIVHDGEDDMKLENTTRDIKELIAKYPWLPELGAHYWID